VDFFSLDNSWKDFWGGRAGGHEGKKEKKRKEKKRGGEAQVGISFLGSTQGPQQHTAPPTPKLNKTRVHIIIQPAGQLRK
jgi:hypothetical protein